MSEEARRTPRYVEPLSDARTPLADFSSILLVNVPVGAAGEGLVFGLAAGACGAHEHILSQPPRFPIEWRLNRGKYAIRKLRGQPRAC